LFALRNSIEDFDFEAALTVEAGDEEST